MYILPGHSLWPFVHFHTARSTGPPQTTEFVLSFMTNIHVLINVSSALRVHIDSSIVFWNYPYLLQLKKYQHFSLKHVFSKCSPTGFGFLSRIATPVFSISFFLPHYIPFPSHCVLNLPSMIGSMAYPLFSVVVSC